MDTSDDKNASYQVRLTIGQLESRAAYFLTKQIAEEGLLTLAEAKELFTSGNEVFVDDLDEKTAQRLTDVLTAAGIDAVFSKMEAIALSVDKRVWLDVAVRTFAIMLLIATIVGGAQLLFGWSPPSERLFEEQLERYGKDQQRLYDAIDEYVGHWQRGYGRRWSSRFHLPGLECDVIDFHRPSGQVSEQGLYLDCVTPVADCEEIDGFFRMMVRLVERWQRSRHCFQRAELFIFDEDKEELLAWKDARAELQWTREPWRGGDADCQARLTLQSPNWTRERTVRRDLPDGVADRAPSASP